MIEDLVRQIAIIQRRLDSLVKPETPVGGSGQPLDPDLTAIAALSGTGILARIASESWALRTITAGTAVSITNGDGVAGNPVINAIPTLANVATNSTTTPHQTFALKDNTKFILEDAAGVDIFVIDEAGLTLRMLRGLTPPGLEVLNPAGFIVGLKATEAAGSVGFYMQNSADDGYAEMLFVNEDGEFEDVMSVGIGNTASDAPYTNRGYFYTADNLDGLLFQAGAAGATIRFDAGGFDNEVMRITTTGVGIGVTPVTRLHTITTDAVTNAITDIATLGHNSSGTPAANFGTGLLFQGESSTTADQSMGRLAWLWATATHASRLSRGKLTAYSTSNEVECIRWEATGAATGTITLPVLGSGLVKATSGVLSIASGSSDYQPFDAFLTSIAALGTAADKMIYTTGVDTAAETGLSAFARSFLDDASEAVFKATVNLEIGVDVQAWDADLDALAALAATAGMLSRTGAGAFAVRTLTAPAAGITITNGTGAAGNPTLALANDLAALEGLGSTGIAARTAADTWAQRTITGTASRVTVTNGDGVSGNPTIDIDDAVLTSVATSYDQPNPIINGDFAIAQRTTSTVSAPAGQYTIDRFYYTKNGAMIHSIIQDTDVPTIAEAGVKALFCAEVDCVTVDSSIAAGDYCFYGTKIEGYNILHIAQQAFTLSFWVKATKTGIHCVAFENTGGNRSYVAEYTISAANTWEFKVINVSASPSAGTWDYTTGIGMYVSWILAAGSTYHTTAGAWQTGDFLATSNQVNACDNVNNDFRIALVQILPGTLTAPTYISVPYAVQLARCQRYFWKTFPILTPVAQGTSPDTGEYTWSAIAAGAVTQRGPFMPFAVPMRATPTITLYNPTISSAQVRDETAAAECTASASVATERGVRVSCTGNASTATNNVLGVHIAANAEL